MKLKALFFILFSLNFSVAFCETTYRQDFDHLASINFPNVPQTTAIAGLLTYKLALNGNSYDALIYDVSNSKNKIETQNDLNNFYDGVINGAINSSKKLEVRYKKNITIDGLNGIEFEYSVSIDPEKTIFVRQRVLYFNSIVFSYMFITPDESLKGNEIAKDKFFNSFRITINKQKVKQFTSASAFTFGYLSGKGFAYSLTIALIAIFGFGALYVKKLNNKRTNE